MSPSPASYVTHSPCLGDEFSLASAPSSSGGRDGAAAELQAPMAIATVVSVMSCLKLEIMMDSLVGMGLAVATHKSRDSVVSCFSSRETAD